MWLAILCVKWYHAVCALGFIDTRVKGPNKPSRFFEVVKYNFNIYLCSVRYCLMETRNCSLVRSSGGGTFLLVCTCWVSWLPSPFLLSYGGVQDVTATLLLFSNSWHPYDSKRRRGGTEREGGGRGGSFFVFSVVKTKVMGRRKAT